MSTVLTGTAALVTGASSGIGTAAARALAAHGAAVALLARRADRLHELKADIADAVLYMVTRDRRVAVTQMLVRAAEQTW
jgi:NADP-dependent 3-hydroxy acid dehydrogenase YdfG